MNVWRDENGGILIMALILMSTLIILGMSLIKLNTLNYQKTSKDIKSIKARYIAEAGLEKLIVDNLINDMNKDWSDNQYLKIYDNVPCGGGYFTVSSGAGTSNSIDVTTSGLYKDCIKKIEAKLAVDWESIPHKITRLQWHEL